MPAKLIRIIGIGNPLMGDDGIGIHAIQLLHQEALPQSVELIDGGCGGLKLLPLFENCQKLVIIDAADFGAAPGSIRVLNEKDLHCLPGLLALQNSHQFGLPELLRSAQQLKQLPPLSLFLMQVETCRPTNSLSAAVASALPDLLQMIQDRLRKCSTISNHNRIKN